MIKINILSGSQKDPFAAQWDKMNFPESDFYIRENSMESTDWDLVVVYENIKKEHKFRCRTGNVLYFAGEPPMMRPLPNKFLSQFDEVYIPNLNKTHPNLHLSHGYLNWSLGVDFRTKRHRYNFEDLQRLNVSKTKNISIVTSNKRMMPGHNRRMDIINRLRKDFPNDIDFYGTGHNFVAYKADALIPYRFHICMENSTIPYYWTEKFSDPLLAYSVPIYLGCSNITDYFDGRGFETFDCNNYEKLKSLIQTIIDNPDKMYNKYYPFMVENRKRIMTTENLVSFVCNLSIERHNSDFIDYTINALDSFKEYHRAFYIIRIKRLLYKLFSLLK